MKQLTGSESRLLLTVLLTCILGVAASCTEQKNPTSPTLKTKATQDADQQRLSQDPAAVWQQFLAVNFAGDQACADCHRKEYEAHQRSGHSNTAVRMQESALAESLVKAGDYQDSRRDQKWIFETSDGEFLVKDEKHAAMPPLPVSWLLGSGTHAQTAIAVDERRQKGVELRWSYFANQKGLGLTPDHERFDEYNRNSIECFGRPMQAADVLACLGCHMTVGPPPGAPFRAEFFIPNVGCERCHGPRKQHVELAKIGRGHESKPLINYASAEQYIAACAQCHRDENNLSANSQPNEQVRFQPYGLKKSLCYLNSNGKLSCAYCHDPHDATSHNRVQYIKQCQSCHQAAEHSTVCPVKPQGDCIECHMPAVEWTAGIRFHDHWIRKPGS
ncbi:MAG: multiheme c-type cytochrome [Planctomycetota bacterium]